MIMKNGKQVNFIYKNGKKIDKIIRHGKVYFEQGFTREKTSTTFPITFGGVGKDLKDYKVYGNTYQNSTSGKNKYGITSAKGYSYSSSLPNVPNQNMIIDFYDLNNIEFHAKSNAYLIALLPTIQLQANTDYILSYVRINNIISGNPRRYIYAVDENENYSLINSVTSGDVGNISHQFTTSSSGKIALAFGYSNNSNESSSIINNLMVRLATDTDNTFEPYTGEQPSPNPDYPQEIISCGDLITDTTDVNYGKYKIPVNINNVIINIYLDEPLRKIDGYSDYIDFINGKVVRNIDEVILDGSETWNGVQDYQSSTTMASKNGTISVMIRMNETNNLISNKFNVQKNDNINDNITAQSNLENAHFCIRKNNPDRIYFKWENWQGKTGNEVKEIVTLEPITINYPLLTPTEESITLPNIPTVDGNNILNIETEITPSQIYIKYKSNN